ncbi:hypothetical protein LCGC14_0565010 [marine sediment metagenome]|uniref:Uncharacterized protein n=1 Tax=marine sediment metagenome TaxID=412755 RepID=A0A0F9UU60_9ZZZZ
MTFKFKGKDIEAVEDRFIPPGQMFLINKKKFIESVTRAWWEEVGVKLDTIEVED